MKPKQLGDVSVHAILEWAGLYRGPLDMYPDATPEIIDRHRSWMAPECYDGNEDRMIFAFQSFLVRTGRQTILIDTCVGDDKDRPARPDWHRQKWPWMDNLRAAGVTPEEIDVVLCTHLHVDHVGWNTQLRDGRWVPTFPNAKYIFGRTEFEHWNENYRDLDWLKNSYEDSVVPIVEAKQHLLVDDGHEIGTGIWLEETPGHTPGSMCMHLDTGGQKAIFSGDLMHHPIQVPESQLSTIFCWDREQSHKTRAAFLDRHADSGTLILPAHFPGRTAGRIVRQGDGLMFEFSEE